MRRFDPGPRLQYFQQLSSYPLLYGKGHCSDSVSFFRFRRWEPTPALGTEASGYGWNRFVKMVDQVLPKRGSTFAEKASDSRCHLSATGVACSTDCRYRFWGFSLQALGIPKDHLYLGMTQERGKGHEINPRLCRPRCPGMAKVIQPELCHLANPHSPIMALLTLGTGRDASVSQGKRKGACNPSMRLPRTLLADEVSGTRRRAAFVLPKGLKRNPPARFTFWG